MHVIGHVVDSEGYVHVELEPGCDTNFKKAAVLGMLSKKYGINRIIDFDRRVEEDTGFEFWHIKGV